MLAVAFLSMGALTCSAAERKTASAASRPASKTRDASKARAGQALAKLKEKGIIQSAQELRSAKGVDVMRRAIIYSKPAVLKLMLIAGADATAKDEWGKPLLALAVEFADPQCTKDLLDAGAKVESLPAESLVDLAFRRTQENEVSQTIQLLLKDEAGLRKTGFDWEKIGDKGFKDSEYPFVRLVEATLKSEGEGYDSLADRVRLLAKMGGIISGSGKEGNLLAESPKTAGALKALLEAGLAPNPADKGLSLLHRAASSGSAETIRYLIEAGANVHAVVESTGQTALMKAAGREGNTYFRRWTSNGIEERGEIVRLLLAAGADPLAKDKAGKTALQLMEEFCRKNPYIETLPTWKQGYEQASSLLGEAAAKGNKGKLFATPLPTKHQRKHYGKWVREGGKERFVPSLSAEEARKILKDAVLDAKKSLFAVARAGDAEGLELLLAAGVKVAGVKEGDESLLMVAIEGGNAEVVRLLLSAGADAKEANKEGLLPLHVAARYQMADCLLMLVPEGADVNVEAKDKSTALELACGSAECTRILLEAGAKLQSENPRYLRKAAAAASPESLRLLLAAGASPKAEEGDKKSSPLAEAAGAGSVECVKILLQAGANPNVITPWNYGTVGGESSLVGAVRAISPACLKLLLEGGADVSLHESKGLELLTKAVDSHSLSYKDEEKKAECVRLLLAAGADFRKGRPLHAAASDGCSRSLKLLLDAGADVTALDDTGKTPLQIAEERNKLEMAFSRERIGYRECVELLREAEAKKGKAPR